MILDTAPVGMVTDTLLIGRVADLSVYVCRADYTHKAEFTLINELAENNKLPNLCIAVNGLDLNSRKYGYYYGYAKRSGEYGAWYMLNVYPQRATNPNNMDIDDTYSMEIHLRNLAAIEELLSTIERADVWCAWGAIIDDTKRTYLSDLLFGNEDKNIQGIISLFSGNYHFKAYGATTKGYPKHPLLIGKEAKLKSLDDIGLKELSDRITNNIKK